MAKKKSDLSRAFSEDGDKKTHVGGQALIEGIMMRGKKTWAVAVREPDGNIYVEQHELASGKEKRGWMAKPFIRGCVALVESLALGFKALEIAADHAFADEEAEDKASVVANELVDELESNFDSDETVKTFVVDSCKPVEVSSSESPSTSIEKKCISKDSSKDTPEDSSDGLGKGAMTVSMIMGIVLGVALFIIVPAVVTNLIVGEYDDKTILWNIVDGILRVAIFIFYIWLIGRMEDIRRMFMYHGAEHKTIHCYEHGLDLTPENARQFPRLHVRCGTAFLIMVLVIAIIVYTVLPINAIIESFGIADGIAKLALVIGIRILFLPLIAGISYEITVKWAGSHPDNPLVKVILWPGMQMQYLTTNEPEDDQLECAIIAMKKVLAQEEG